MLTKNSQLQPIEQLIESIENGTFVGCNIHIQNPYMDDNLASRLCAALTRNTAVAARITSITIQAKLLTNFVLPNTLTALTKISFTHSRTASVNIPNTLTALKKIILNNNQLTSLDIPSTLTALEDIRLYCNRLTNFNIPDTLTALKKILLHGNQLTSLDIPRTLTALEDIRLYRNRLTDFNMPDTLTALKKINLYGNYLTSLNIPNTLVSLEEIVLYNNRLTSFNIPATLTALNRINLQHNSQLRDITASVTIHNLCSIYVGFNTLLSEFEKWKLRQSFAYIFVGFNTQYIDIRSIREYYNTFCTTKKLVDRAMTPSLKLRITRDIINSQLISKFCMNNGECDNIGMRIAEFLVPRLGLEKSLDSCGLNAPLRERADVYMVQSPEVRAEVDSLDAKVIADATGYEKTKFLYYNFNRIKNSNLGRDISLINTIEKVFPAEQRAECSIMSQSRQKPKRMKL